MKNLIIVTGGAGFVGSNLIKSLLKKTNKKIISLDNYSSGNKNNHLKNIRVKYVKGNTVNISNLFNKIKSQIHSIFHFGEFARIYQSFKRFDECFKSNSIGSNEVFKFCLDNNIKLIYSATSASLGNKGGDKNLSPYAFTKSKNLELLENLRKWFNFKFEVIYFYNVYGPGQIKVGNMATVVGIFENQYSNNKPLTIVKPGTQTRRFTHIDDTINVCIDAWKKNKCHHYSISHKKSYSIISLAKMFKSKVIYLNPRLGERYASALTKMSNNRKIINKYGKIDLKDYVTSFIKGEKL
ncbi:ADP-L-glycero-D-mannoheptose-6-epimerase [Candidatus Pelagibacter sp. HTCC7211]|uniref:NAD-dependent epimerase/dehydratase family protein n=1 Tax=Pelagibacter sp. (strain HTCC7211) TaxID=439493 RepID=UPI000183A1D3|nr:NAD-dependent epimerase/dehydratase family protein [Candidatus Pelagibacter sp. HTCC7211]EDZ60233.1 ADP-L-glycero-D-mannoheptose-6-epimerase [Candidatus Pelagibacter sp. HTCC7211]MBD1151462.1 NAD-dependent epimerase/dehydratase family protein [Pelagibacterales bacterium SAG-MED25]